MGSDVQATSYPTRQQYGRWKDEADKRDMGISEFMQAMVEAGLKKFNTNIEPDETNRKLRQQRNELKSELDRTRERVSELEHRMHQTEYKAIEEYVRDNPGVSFEEIVQNMIDSAPQRVNEHLDALEGDGLYFEEDGYFVDDRGDKNE